jgi:hypothetical protein
MDAGVTTAEVFAVIDCVAVVSVPVERYGEMMLLNTS